MRPKVACHVWMCLAACRIRRSVSSERLNGARGGRTSVDRLVVDDEGRAGDDRDKRRVLEDLVKLQTLALVSCSRRLRLEEENACERASWL